VPARLLDTNIVSYMVKRHRLLARYLPHITGYDLGISFLTRAELTFGALRAGWGQRQWDRLEAVTAPMVVLHSDDDICELWSAIRVARSARPIDVADAWIAATALAYGLELVTHNPSDFAGIPGLTVVAEAP
jgi:tRNA(fMet)-specific endonuclease VapC